MIDLNELWMINYNAMIQFIKENSSLPPVNKTSLGMWMSNQRQKKRKGLSL